eukprot:662978-Amphidinium_carterae.2
MSNGQSSQALALSHQLTGQGGLKEELDPWCDRNWQSSTSKCSHWLGSNRAWCCELPLSYYLVTYHIPV